MNPHSRSKLVTEKIREELTGLLHDMDKLFEIVDRNLENSARTKSFSKSRIATKKHIKEIMKAI